MHHAQSIEVLSRRWRQEHLFGGASNCNFLFDNNHFLSLWWNRLISALIHWPLNQSLWAILWWPPMIFSCQVSVTQCTISILHFNYHQHSLIFFQGQIVVQQNLHTILAPGLILVSCWYLTLLDMNYHHLLRHRTTFGLAMFQ